MTKRYYFDVRTGLVTIKRAADARDVPSPEEIKEWMATGAAPVTEEPDRCPTCGRSEECACGNCSYCDESGVPMAPWQRGSQSAPTGTEDNRGETPQGVR